MSVPWENFAAAFYRAINEVPLSDREKEKNSKYKLLKSMLATTPEEGPLEATLERFGHFLGWFGPLSEGYLERLRKTMVEEWFHGDITKNEAESVLLSWKKKGSFLVRVSVTDPFANPYTLSMLNGKLVEHLRIGAMKTGDTFGYYTNIKIKGQLQRLESEGGVENLVKRMIKHLELKTACLGSKYQSLFNSSSSTGVGDGYL